MKNQQMMAHLGQYVFMVVDGGRSFPCWVLRVTDDEVIVIETDHDDWPLTLRRVPTGNVVYVEVGADIDTAMDTVYDPKMPFGASDVFGRWRAELNDEDLLARPSKTKKTKVEKGASA